MNILPIILALSSFLPSSLASFKLDQLAPEGFPNAMEGLGHLDLNPNATKSRVRRQLIDFPDDAVLEFVFKLVTPYWKYDKASTSGDYRFELTFELPNELRRRRRRSLGDDRDNMYTMLGNAMEKTGLLGEECVLRAVCEVAESPLEEHGMMGELLNLVFAPGFRAQGSHPNHLQAEEYGRSYGNCWSAFPECPMSLREILQDFFTTGAAIHDKTEL